MSRNIQITAGDGGQFTAYLAEPTGAGKAPAIVVAHEIFGVNPSMRATADALAAEGFIVAVPDIFWRQTPGVQLDPAQEADRNQGISLLKGLNEEQAIADIEATAAHLRSLDNCNGKVGVVGYCMGGKLAYLSAIAGFPAVSYYGVAIDGALDKAGDLKAPVLLHIPELDELCPPEAQERIKQALSAFPTASISSHPNVGHAFARKNAPTRHDATAEKADTETVGFMRQHLAG